MESDLNFGWVINGILPAFHLRFIMYHIILLTNWLSVFIFNLTSFLFDGLINFISCLFFSLLLWLLQGTSSTRCKLIFSFFNFAPQGIFCLFSLLNVCSILNNLLHSRGFLYITYCGSCISLISLFARVDILYTWWRLILRYIGSNAIFVLGDPSWRVGVRNIRRCLNRRFTGCVVVTGKGLGWLSFVSCTTHLNFNNKFIRTKQPLLPNFQRQ